MQLRINTSEKPQVSSFAPLAIFVLALVVLLSALVLSRSAVPTVSLPAGEQAASDTSFTAKLPDRSFSYLYATGTEGGGTTTSTGGGGGGGGAGPAGITDSRLNAAVPGAEALLAAVYPASNGGFTVWTIDPASGEGTFVFRVLRGMIDTAQTKALETGAPVLIAPSTEGTLPAVYASPDGECILNSMYPDGKTAQVVFAC